MTRADYDKALELVEGDTVEVDVGELTLFILAAEEAWQSEFPSHEISLPRFIASHLLHRFRIVRK